jgi:hypothetical protein
MRTVTYDQRELVSIRAAALLGAARRREFGVPGLIEQVDQRI